MGIDWNPGNALVIYNPRAGTAIDIDLCLGALIHKLCHSLKLSVTVRSTEPNAVGTDLLSGVDDLKLVIAAGGDGTIRLVLGALSEMFPDTPAGIIPLGTGNQLARNLGIYEENLLNDPFEEALRIILHGHTQRIDLGKMNGHYFCVAAGAGPISDAIVLPSHVDKTNFKMLAYAGAVLQNFSKPPVVFRVETETDNFEVAAVGIFVTNVAEYGVGTLSGTAECDDGLLDLCIMNPTEFTDFLQLGFRFVSGMSGNEAPYYIKKVSSVNLSVVPVASQLSDLQTIAQNIRTVITGKPDAPPTDEVVAMIDGDACGTTPMSIEVVPHAVSVFTSANLK